MRGLLSELSFPWNREQTDSLTQGIIEAGPRYQDLAVFMQPTRKPRFDGAFYVMGSVHPRHLIYVCSAPDSGRLEGSVMNSRKRPGHSAPAEIALGKIIIFVILGPFYPQLGRIREHGIRWSRYVILAGS